MGNYNWNWSLLVQAPYFGWLMSGVTWTIMLALSAWVIALTVGSLVGIARTLPLAGVRWVATAYVEVFRNVPLLAQMFLWFFVLPQLVPAEFGRWLKRDMPNPEFVSAMLCLGFYTASRVAEQVRAGISSIPTGLTAAARSNGINLVQTYRYILLPIAYRIIVPPMTSEFLGIFKNTSIALTIGVMEITAQSRQIESYTFHGYEAFTAALLLYLGVSMTLLFMMRKIENRSRIPGWLSREDTP